MSASYDREMDRLQLQTSIADGPMTLVLQAGQAWELRAKFFRVVTEGLRDSLPDSMRIVLEFQAAAESSPGSGELGPPVPAPDEWAAELASLQGLRFIRYRLTFDIDAQEQGADLSSPRPRVEYLKLPFAW